MGKKFVPNKKKDIGNDVVNNEAIKRVTRASASRDVERVVHLKSFDLSKKLGEFSDDESTKTETPLDKTPAEFGGTLGAIFFILSLPLAVVALYAFCNESQCSVTKLPNFKKFLSLPVFFNLTTILGYFAFANVLALISALPFGGKKVEGMPNKQGKLTYVMNGLFGLCVIVAILIGMEYRKIPILNYIVDHIFHLAVASAIFGLVVSIYLYIRSFYVPVSALNVSAVGKPRICAFFLGREVNPRLFDIVDLKFFFLRISIISLILIDAAYLYRSLGYTFGSGFDLKALNIQPTLIILTLLHFIYLFDPLLFEDTWLTSFEIQYEGLGYMGAVGYPLYPFMFAAQTKYIVDYGVHLPTYQLVLSGILFTIGYIFFHGANGQKDAFRKNPYSPSVSNLETIPTSSGKKLICSGFWGIVRHPNYLGDILMNLSFLPFVLCVPPCIFIYSIVCLLIHRSHRDNQRCKQKYGNSWDRYCQKVKYVLIPKVY